MSFKLFSDEDRSPSSSRYDIVLDRNADLIRMYYKTAIFYYFLLFSKILEILDKVFITKNIKNIPDELNDHYEIFWRTLWHFKTREDFVNVSGIKDNTFESLHCDFDYTANAWAKARKLFYEDLENIRKQVPQAYPIPFDIESTFLKVDKLLENEAEYKIDYKFSGEIVLNNNYLLAKLNFNSLNDRFFSYVFNNPRKKIKKQEFLEPDDDFHKILNKIGFKGELLKIFFSKTSMSTVYFNNDLTSEDLKNINYDQAKLELEINLLSRI